MATRRARAETTTSDLRAVNTFLLTYDSSSAKGLLSQLRVSLVSGELDEDLLERRLADAVVLDKAALFSSLHEGKEISQRNVVLECVRECVGVLVRWLPGRKLPAQKVKGCRLVERGDCD
mmetsp:Transcript_3325/g.10187  ORF Transcript_3325/g.10187 Transcript_3325/m.10187 type:complete len:120 (+) Transcript_3325:105-464(+)